MDYDCARLQISFPLSHPNTFGRILYWWFMRVAHLGDEEYSCGRSATFYGSRALNCRRQPPHREAAQTQQQLRWGFARLNLTRQESSFLWYSVGPKSEGVGFNSMTLFEINVQAEDLSCLKHRCCLLWETNPNPKPSEYAAGASQKMLRPHSHYDCRVSQMKMKI